MNQESLKKRTVTGFIWRFAERCGAQGVNFIVNLVLARILMPETYGTIAIVTVVISILQVFIDSGTGNSLIQKRDSDNLDFSTVFYFNFLVCIIVYICVYISAPYIANFYNTDSLTLIIRVLSITLIISGVKNIQQAYVSKNMLFRRFFFSTLCGIIVSAIIGIVLAYNGAGVWALVAQQLSNTLIDTIILWITVKWRPQLIFSFERLKILFGFGWKLLASNLIDTVYNNVRQLIIGRVYQPASLAFYNRGKQIPNLFITNINSSLDSVLLPAISKVQDDKRSVKSMTRRSIRISSYIIWPIMVGIAVCAEPIILLLLTEKWVQCVPYLQVFCFSYAFWPIHTANLNAIKAVGKSDIFLKLEIIKKIIGVFSIIISINSGVFAIAVAYAATSPISAIINAYPNRKLLGYTYFEQVKDMIPSMVLSLIMGLCVYPIKYLPLTGNVIILVIQIIVGALIYILVSYFTRMEPFIYIINNVRKLKKEKINAG